MCTCYCEHVQLTCRTKEYRDPLSIGMTTKLCTKQLNCHWKTGNESTFSLYLWRWDIMPPTPGFKYVFAYSRLQRCICLLQTSKHPRTSNAGEKSHYLYFGCIIFFFFLFFFLFFLFLFLFLFIFIFQIEQKKSGKAKPNIIFCITFSELKVHKPIREQGTLSGSKNFLR